MKDFIEKSARKVLTGEAVSKDEVLKISQTGEEEVLLLLEAANRIRKRFKGKEVDLCAIVNAKSGRCSEDCIFCAQSGHYQTTIEKFPLIPVTEILNSARAATGMQAARFGIVTSGRGIDDREIGLIREALHILKQEIPLSRCASLGTLTKKKAKFLKDSGLQRYHHNLETSEKFFPQVCTTHSFQERIETISIAKEIGLEVCSGGIFGLGESYKDRIDLAFTLKELEVDSIPLNFLYPIPGTPCEKMKPLSPLEILKTIAIFRFILPDKDIKVCGGREKNLRSLQPLLFIAGANGVLIGNYLTTIGQKPEDDLQMIKDLGLKIRNRPQSIDHGP